MALAPGQYLDRYKLVVQAGEGGQGAVWKAIDEHNNRVVAIKLHKLSEGDLGQMQQIQVSHSTHLARLRREAEALRRISHPSVVRCLGVFEDYERDILGLVLEWVEGHSLAEARKNPRLTQAHRMWLLGHLIRALAYLHKEGFVHRDLKFGNVLISEHFWDAPSSPEHIKLVDLGVAAPVGNPDPLTIVGTFVGTSAYVAPEIVLRGKNPALSASTASDVFAFGVLGWRLLSGEHPTGLPLKADFTQFIAFYQAVIAGTTSWPGHGAVEGPWGEVLRRCLTIDVNERPRSASDIVDLIEGRTPLHKASIEDERTDDDKLVTRFFVPPDRARPQPTPPPGSAPGPVSPPSHLQTPVPGSAPGSGPRPVPPPVARSTPPPAGPLPPPVPTYESNRPSSPYQPLPHTPRGASVSSVPTPVPLSPPPGAAPYLASMAPTLPPTHQLAPAAHDESRSSRGLIAVIVVATVLLIAGIVALVMVRSTKKSALLDLPHQISVALGASEA